ncbi:alpha/beta-hydrolase [Pseudovirgaria hyperparasitica]|uniref:Dipeptidyl-peptidase V n=1 Tax=Pseudovirgaria hyperparasitica TaxID=470096 RepID=A0A6A6VVD5_9PEZI|nr:alpha/beta-hydrolase [Pseudovirgaria hyperparasitica]KAF2754532.1 alpha/beta-hydrolase [Pseudovirgaria hyperparasitica]
MTVNYVNRNPIQSASPGVTSIAASMGSIADNELIDNLMNLQVPKTPKVSPNTSQVAYCTTLEWGHRTGEHPRSTLWLAATDKKDSTRQLTSGLYNDFEPHWSPDGKSIAFLSDRARPGKSCAIYILPIEDGGEAIPGSAANTENERQIVALQWSPDGTSIAFVSADEKTKEEKEREEMKDDAAVWGQQLAFNKVRLLDIATGEITVLNFDVHEAARIKNHHVLGVCWSPDSQSLAIWTARTPYLEHEFIYGSEICIMSKEGIGLERLCTCDTQIKSLSWESHGMLHFITSFPSGNLAATALYKVDVRGKTEPQHMAYGEVDDAAESKIINRDTIVVRTQRALDTCFELFGGVTMLSYQNDIKEWDVAFDSTTGKTILAFVKSDINTPSEVYTAMYTAIPNADMASAARASPSSPVSLSKHGSLFVSKRFGTFTVIKTRSFDRKESLDGIFLTPAQHTTSDGTPTHALPTIVLPHGGPTDRNTDRFNAYYYYIAPYLLHHGYAILLINYRGSSSYGARFAQYACGGMGQYEYPDIIAVTQCAIDSGYADAHKLVVGGWSQGGFLSYLCAVRNNNLKEEGFERKWMWKACIPGAGITDWDAMALTSDLGASIESELAGVTPWRSSKEDVTSRSGSALWEFDGAMQRGKGMWNRGLPPMLMLHGEKDERCPITQAWGMRRALESYGLEHTFVTYPREPHAFGEQKHWIDLVKRVKGWCDKYIGPQA